MERKWKKLKLNFNPSRALSAKFFSLKKKKTI